MVKKDYLEENLVILEGKPKACLSKRVCGIWLISIYNVVLIGTLFGWLLKD